MSAERGMFIENMFEDKLTDGLTWALRGGRSLIAVDSRLKEDVLDAKVGELRLNGPDYFMVVTKGRMRLKWELKGVVKREMRGRTRNERLYDSGYVQICGRRVNELPCFMI